VTDENEATGLTIAQMAGAIGVSAHTLRYYERVGLIHPVGRNPGNQRRYSQSDVAWLKFLLRLRETGMPIAQMRQYADLRAAGAPTIEARLDMLEAHREQLRVQITLLRGHEEALDAKIATYRDDLAELRANEDLTEGATTHE
jgi:DNA-binding transcriptional MerR regulator